MASEEQLPDDVRKALDAYRDAIDDDNGGRGMARSRADSAIVAALAVERTRASAAESALRESRDRFAEVFAEVTRLRAETDAHTNQDRAARTAKRYLDLGATLCEAHQHWHMPDEGCWRCNPPPPPTPEEQAQIDGWLANLPTRRATARERAYEAMAKGRTGPTSTTVVIQALISRMRETAARLAKDPQPLRERAHALYEDDPAMADMLAGAANAIDDVKRELATMRADIEAAAGELLVDIPEPGTDAARMMSANVLMRRELEDVRHRLWPVQHAARRYAAPGVSLGPGPVLEAALGTIAGEEVDCGE
jgi:hypothetical protein